MSNIQTRVLTREIEGATSWRGAGYHGNSHAARAVSNWHDETHAGSFLTCQEQPCAAVRLADD